MEVMAACREGEPLERNVAEMESGPGAVEARSDFTADRVSSSVNGLFSGLS
jgi:hypothetical protein